MSVLTFFLIYTFHCVNFDAIALIENDTFWKYILILFTNNVENFEFFMKFEFLRKIRAWFCVVCEKTWAWRLYFQKVSISINVMASKLTQWIEKNIFAFSARKNRLKFCFFLIGLMVSVRLFLSYRSVIKEISISHSVFPGSNIYGFEIISTLFSLVSKSNMKSVST